MDELRERIAVQRPCPFCNKEQEVWVFKSDLKDWREGKLAQNAFPYLSSSEREILISGMCDDCWPKED